MKPVKNSIGVKLWCYIILFAAVILSALWLMQVVFLQSFYEGMKTKEVEKLVNTLVDSYDKEDFESTLDKTAFVNSVLIFVTDTEGNIIYATDEHGPGKPPQKDKPVDFFRPLPNDFNDFLERLLQSETAYLSYTVDHKNFRGKSLICGVLISGEVIYLSAPLDPVDSTISILRTQLVYVIIAALVLSLVIAYFISMKFTKPLTSITKEAKKLAEGEFPKEFDKGFCAELDELADTLAYASTELSKVEMLRRELIANISHDLRTPLTMIKAYSEMIRDISGDNKTKREEHLEIITAETERLTELVNDILVLSSIQSDNESLTLENLNMSNIVKEILSRFKPMFTHEGYSFHTDLELDQYVYADKSKIKQVLYNLIGNAMNYIGDDKVVAVKVKNVDGWVRVEISDHGEGISEDEVDLIWDRYYKSNSIRRNVKTGAGLGLSIVKGILEMHKARFGVESQIECGSTFWFELKK